MNTRLLLGGSAMTLGVAGAGATFLPHEILAALGMAPDGWAPILVQLLGALWFAFAMANWTAKGTAIGGIYGRPLTLGNLTHFVVGALALVKAALDETTSPVLVTLAAVYVLFAVAFTWAFLRSPVPPRT